MSQNKENLTSEQDTPLDLSAMDDILGEDNTLSPDNEETLVIEDDKIDNSVIKTEKDTGFDLSGFIKLKPITEGGHRVNITRPISSPGEKYDSSKTYLTLPSIDDTLLSEVPDKIPEEVDPLLTQEAREWYNVVQDSSGKAVNEGIHEERLKNPESEFDQYVIARNGRHFSLIDSNIKLPNKSGSGGISGDYAVMFANRKLGISTQSKVSLPHSGLFLALKEPSDEDLLTLNRLQYEATVKLGRSTYGTGFTNRRASTIGLLINHILSNYLMTSSISLDPKSEDNLIVTIMKNTVIHDLDILLIGCLSNIFPQGIQYRRPCLESIGTCHYIATDLLNLKECVVIDNRMLTDYHREFLEVAKARTKTVEDLENYRNTLPSNINRLLVVETLKGGKFTIELKVPTVYDLVTNGDKWIQSITNLVDHVAKISKTISEEMTVAQKRTLISQHAKLSTLREYGAWIKEIRLDDGSVLNDQDTIEKQLKSLTSDLHIRNQITAGINKYMGDSVIALVCINKFVCPECNKESTSEHRSAFSEVIPLDAIELFFTIVTQKIRDGLTS